MDLFSSLASKTPSIERLSTGTFLLHGFALANEVQIIHDIDRITELAPLRQMITPGGFKMSVAMSNCGKFGWVTDRRGYRYDSIDPVSGKPWPDMPDSMLDLATKAAHAAGFANFIPDACLINRYEPGSRMSLHQDKNELDFSQPIVSVSLGIPAVFLFGGLERANKTLRLPLLHGDVLVWGNEDRLRFHGILPLKLAYHPTLGELRINLTFRKAG